MMCSYTNKADFPTTPLQIWLASVEPLYEVLAEVSLFYVGTWKVGSSLSWPFGKGPTASTALAAGFGWTALP